MAVEVKHRHKFWQRMIRPFIHYFLMKRKFNYTSEKYKIKPPYILLGNHTTDYDAFFMANSFKDPLYFVMSDHISSLKVGKIIEHLVCPIPITKSTHDASTVRGIMSVIRQGAPVALFPEGNKSFAGEMSQMKPTIGKLLKKLKVPVVIYNIEGGYFSSPRWTHKKRKGKMRGFVKRVITPEEIENLSAEEIFEIIKTDLRVNAYEVQEREHVKFVGKDLAENIETLLYMCPKCGALSSLHGHGNTFSCDKCDFTASYNQYGYIEGHTLSRLDEMDKWQKDQLRLMDFDSLPEDYVITGDDGFIVKEKVDKYTNKEIGEYRLELFKDRLVIKNDNESRTLPLSEINGYAVEGVNGLQFSLRDGRVYRLNNPGPVSGLKYVNLYAAITKQEYKF